MKQSIWRVQAGAVLNGLLFLTLAGLVGNIFEAIGSADEQVDLARSFMNGDLSDNFKPDGWDMASWMMMLLEVFGYILYYNGLKQFAKIQDTQDAACILNVRTGTILTMVGIIIGHIPMLGWLPKLILVIVGFVKMLQGYKGLKNSSSFPATNGAATLHSALILQLIGILIGLLPVFGDIIESIIDIIVFFMIIDGWRTIKNTVPPASKSLPEIQLLPFRKIPGGQLLAWGLGIFIGGTLINRLFPYIYRELIKNGFDISFHSDKVFSYANVLHYLAYLTLTSFIIYGIGVGKAAFYRKSSKIQGTVLVLIGLFLHLFIEIGPFLYYLLTKFSLYDLPLSFTFTNLLDSTAWILCAIGFHRIGTTNQHNYMRKHGSNLLAASAWIYAGMSFGWMLYQLGLYCYHGDSLHYYLSDNDNLKVPFQIISGTLDILSILKIVACPILLWKGWKLLLSSWYGENDPELSKPNESTEENEVVETGNIKKTQETEVTKNVHKEYTKALSLKSDGELKALIRDEKMYETIFIAMARKELTERVINKRQQKEQEADLSE